MNHWSNITMALAGLLLATAIVFTLYNTAISPLINYDISSFYNTQTKSTVYTHGLLDVETVTSKNVDKYMYKETHILMLPAVDVEFDPNSSNTGRTINIYNDLHYTQLDPGTIITPGGYSMSNAAIYDKSLTFNSFTYANQHTALLGLRTATATNGFSLMVEGHISVGGVKPSSSLIFYNQPRKERQRP